MLPTSDARVSVLWHSCVLSCNDVRGMFRATRETF